MIIRLRFNTWQDWHENFPLKSEFIRCPFNPHVTAVAHKRPWSYCNKCRWRVNLNTDPRKQEWADCCPGRVWEPIRKTSSHANHKGLLGQWSQIAEPLWTDPGLNSGIGVQNHIHLKKKKKLKAQAGNDSLNLNKNKSSYIRNKPTTKTYFCTEANLTDKCISGCILSLEAQNV